MALLQAQPRALATGAAARHSRPALPKRAVLARADGPRVVREYREDDDKMVVPGKDGAMYVDADAKVSMHVNTRGLLWSMRRAG